MEGDNGAETEQAAKDSEGAELESVASSSISGAEAPQETGSQTGQAAKGSEGAELESVASSSISGTEAPQKTESQTDVDIAKPGSAAGNGQPPADIPPTDNDDIIAAQIRQAAETETDPEIQAELWNEYRKYKNLPQE